MNKGFTLVELLITISILGVLSAAVVLILDPAEILRQTRDSNRVTDLSTLNSALSIFLADIDQGDLNGGAKADTECAASGKVYVTVLPATTNSFINRGETPPGLSYVVNALTTVNGTGWLPVDFTLTFGGSAPVKVLPVDPTDTGDLIYRYACNMTSGARTYEIDAQLESVKYKTTLDRDGKDGGDKPLFYEVGNDLNL